MQPIDPWTRYLPPFLRDRLEGRPNLWRIITNIGWLFGDQVLRLGVGLLISIWVTRYLGPERFGALNYAIAFVSLLTPVAVFGLNNVLVRDLVRDPAQEREIVGSAFLVRLIAGAAALAIAIIAAVVLKADDSLQQLLIFIASVTLVLQAFDSIDFWFQAHVRSKYSVLARNASFLVVSVVRMVLVLAGASVVAFAVAYAVEALLAAAALIFVYRLNGQHLSDWRPSCARATELARTTWPLMLSALGFMVSMRVDQIMLGEMRGDAELGIYAAAVRVSELWYMVPNIILLSIAASLTAARQTSAELYQRRVQKTLNLMAGLGYAVALPITLLSGPLINLLYGPEFAAAAAPLAVHIWAAVFYSLGGVLTLWLVNEGLTRFSLASTLAGAAVNLLLNALLIPDHGPMGAAVATVASYAMTFLVAPFFFGPTRPLGKMMLKALVLRS